MSDRGDLTSGDPLGGHRPVAPGPAASEPVAPERPVPTGYGGPVPPGAGGALPVAPAFGGGQLVLAGWWRRAGAAIVDGLIVGAVALAVMAPLGIGLFAAGDSDAGVAAAILGIFAATLVVVVVGFLYAPILMARTNGQTLGRMATGIRVVRTNGQPMTFGWAMLREVAVKGLLINAIAGSVTFGLAVVLDLLWPLWDEENRALHDFLVQTRTVIA